MRFSLSLVLALALLAVAVSAGPCHNPKHTPHHKKPAHVHHHNYKSLDLSSGDAPYNISNSYVLGLSSGGFLAAQMHVAYSSLFSGAGIFAAGPYYCAQGSLITAMENCVEALAPVNLPSLEASAVSFSALNLIDGLKNISGSPVYLFHGSSDRTVFAPVNLALYQMYVDFGANVVFNNGTDANHAWISPQSPNACTVSQSPYMSNCNIDPEFDLLTHILQRTIKPSVTAPTGNTYAFSQDQYALSLFHTTASTFSLDSTGFVYVPASCANNGTFCDLLVALHGCEQGYSSIGGAFMQYANLNNYADTNNLIVLYPQAKVSYVSPSNPEGCWDWWGYTTTLSTTAYAVHGAPQMEIIRAIMTGLGFKGKTSENPNVEFL